MEQRNRESYLSQVLKSLFPHFTRCVSRPAWVSIGGVTHPMFPLELLCHCFVRPEWQRNEGATSMMYHTLSTVNMSCYSGRRYRTFNYSSVNKKKKSLWYELCGLQFGVSILFCLWCCEALSQMSVFDCNCCNVVAVCVEAQKEFSTRLINISH